MPAAYRIVSRIIDQDDFQGTPTDGQVLTYNNAASKWEPQTINVSGYAVLNGGNSFIGPQTFTVNDSSQIPVLIRGTLGQSVPTLQINDQLDAPVAGFSDNGRLAVGTLPVTSGGSPRLVVQPLVGFGGDSNSIECRDNTTAAVMSVSTGGLVTAKGILTTPFNASTTPMVVKGVASQSANLQEWQTSTGTVLISFGATGNATFGTGWIKHNPATSGASNEVFGESAGIALTSGHSNALFGRLAGSSIITGARNTCIGSFAGSSITSGDHNLCIGYLSGGSLTTGSNNTLIGDDTDVKVASQSNGIGLGDGAIPGDAEFTISPFVNLMTLTGFSSTGSPVDKASWSLATIDNTHPTRKYRVLHRVHDTAAREYMRADADGTYPRVSFGGGAVSTTAAVIVRPVVNSEIGLTVSGLASQSGNLQEWQSSAGGNLATVTATGNILLANFNGYQINDALDVPRTLLTLDDSDICSIGTSSADSYYFGNTHTFYNAAGSGITMTLGSVGGATVNSNSAATKGLIVRGFTSQSANLQEWQNSSGTPLTVVESSGSLHVGGTVNEPKLVVNAASTQTQDIVQVYNNSGMKQFAVMGDGIEVAEGGSYWIRDLDNIRYQIATADGGLVILGHQAGTYPTWYMGQTHNFFANVGAGPSGAGTAQLQVQSSAANKVGAVVKAFTGQSVNLQEWQDSSGVAQAYVNKDCKFVGDGSLLINLPAPSGVALTAAANTFTTGPQVMVGGATVRQSGGTPATDEVQIYHDGNRGYLESKDGNLRLIAAGGVATGAFQFSDNAGNVRANIDNVAGAFTTVQGYSVGGGGSAVSINSTGLDLVAGAGGEIRWRPGAFAGFDTGIVRVAGGVVRLADGSTGGGIMEFLQIADGGTCSTNSARIYSKDVAGNAEIFVKDEAGTETQISAHSQTAPASLYDSTDPLPHVLQEVNHYLGGVRYLNLSRACYLLEELLKAFRAGNTHAQIVTFLQNKQASFINIFSQESFAQYNTRLGTSLVKLDWNVEQQKLQDAYDAGRASDLAIHDAWVEAGSIPPEPTVRPLADIRKPKPAWLSTRGA